MPKKFDTSGLKEITGFKPDKQETERLQREQKRNAKANKQVIRDFDTMRKKDPVFRNQEKDFQAFRESNRRDREQREKQQKKEMDKLLSEPKQKKSKSGIKNIVKKVRKSILG